MAASEQVDDQVIELKLPQDSLGEPFGVLVRSAVRFHIMEKRQDRLPWLLTHPSLTENLITELLDSNPDVMMELFNSDSDLLREWGHRSSPQKLLDFLAEKCQYPEAILTIAKNLYTSPNATPSDFQAFLSKHADNEWMLRSLAHLVASMPEKEKALLAVLQNHTAAYNYFIDIQRSLQRHKRAREATNEEAMQELFETGDPAAFHGLALNPLAPEPLLRDLARMKGIKGAREIRELASQALRKFSKQP